MMPDEEKTRMADALKLLLASDFSARCDRPLDRALLLVRENGAKLTIAHILEPHSNSEQVRPIHEIEQYLRSELPPEALSAELLVKTGSAPGMLALLARECGSDLIITGVARHNSWSDYFNGTAVDHLVRHADIPVLIVRKRARGSYQRLVVATDFSDCSIHALRTAAELFPNIPITLVHAFHVPYEAWLKSDNMREHIRAERIAEMEKVLADPSVASLRNRLSTAIEEGELGGVIIRQLRPAASDLLVVGTHGQSALGYATVGSNAEALLACAPVDVLMARDRRRR